MPENIGALGWGSGGCLLRCLATEQHSTEFQTDQESGISLTITPLSCSAT